MRQRKLLAMAVVFIITLTVTTGFALDFSPAPSAAENSYINDSEFLDDTLHVRIEEIECDDSVYHVAYVDITDPSQLRTAISGNPGSSSKAKPSVMAHAFNAVIAINGDSYLYRGSGYIVRQGQILRKAVSLTLDMLIIDTTGNFHVVRKPTKAKITDALKAYEVAQCFTFGPVLVDNSEVQTVYNTYGFAPQDRSPRTAIGQLGPLRYVLVVVDGRQEQSRGVTHKQLAEFMGRLGCTVAYNLDGGGSSTMIFHGQVYNDLSEGEERENSDIIYFSTGITEP